MAYPEPRNLDDIYGPGAENADDGIDAEIVQQSNCRKDCNHTWPASELTNGVCPDCSAEQLLKHLQSQSKERRYETHFE